MAAGPKRFNSYVEVLDCSACISGSCGNAFLKEFTGGTNLARNFSCHKDGKNQETHSEKVGGIKLFVGSRLLGKK